MNQRPQVDGVLFLAVMALLAFGLIMVYSSSAVFAEDRYGDAWYFVKRQVIFVAIGLLAMLAALRLGYQRLVRLGFALLLFTVILLVLVLIPGLGSTAGGSSRWFRVGSFGFQPGELAKVAFVIFLAVSLTRRKEHIQTFSAGFMPHLVIAGVLILLLLGQPDFGTAATLAMLLFFMLFVAGTRLSYILASALAALPMAYLLIVGEGYRMRRLLAFLDPWSDRLDKGYQVTESLISFGSGGLAGLGLGEGKHKLFFLPAAHTDFVFSMVGEELGFIGALLVLGLFVVVVWRGLRAALRAPDLFGTYLAFGLTALIALQVLINVGVVVGLLPTKGLTLPFFSYGGSSMICMLFAAGLLLHVSGSGSASGQVESKLTWP
ncbi:MAG: putative lipid II flippase FtsW [Myxococcales bacterium]|nr:putative lipid II flippase FtsW [Myxococcales bacterium]